MTKIVFKVGDKVYYPSASSKVHTLVANTDNNHNVRYPLQVCSTIFDSEGKGIKAPTAPCIIHATKENYELLSKLYPTVSFESPDRHMRTECAQIILAMFNDDWSCVPCRTPNMGGGFVFMDLITEYVMYDPMPFRGNQHWAYARPFDPKTGKYIVDYVDGKVILEGE